MVNDKNNVINFHTCDKWTLNDLDLFSNSFLGIYKSFLTKDIQNRIIKKKYLEIKDRFYEFQKKERSNDEFDYIFRRYLFYLEKENLYLPLSAYRFVNTISIPTTEEIINNLDLFSIESEKLVIKRIAVSSPGLFSFDGGKIVEQIRELFKDFSWRNKHEKEKAKLENELTRLEIIEKRLKLRKEYPEYFYDDSKGGIFLAKIISEKLEQLKRLEEKGKLLDIGENIDNSENKSR
ncbi:MAG: hypothetical protein GYA52_00265 [Chloroflexi bacterium]|nr:hypothetical protein [Chloroflexota bacterium]